MITDLSFIIFCAGLNLVTDIGYVYAAAATLGLKIIKNSGESFSNLILSKFETR